MAKHTPGPWFRLSGGVISNSVGSDWSNARHFVCSIDTDSECNARLIAAAPDLLEALQALVNMQKGRERWPEVIKAEQAIAKATGD